MSANLDTVKNRIFLSRTNNFDSDFSDFKSLKETQEFRRLYGERYLTVKDTGSSYRVISHWDSKGLLPNNLGSEGWRKFSHFDLVWLKIIQHLREYNVDLDTIKRTKDNILIDNKNIPLFEYYIFKALVGTLDVYVFVLSDGRGDIGFTTDIEDFRSDTGGADSIQISLKAILRELGFTPVRVRQLFSLSESEAELIHAIRFSEPQKIEVTQKGGKIRDIDITQVMTGGSVNSIKSQIGESNDYADIVSSFENGVQQSVKVVRKKRFK